MSLCDSVLDPRSPEPLKSISSQHVHLRPGEQVYHSSSWGRWVCFYVTTDCQPCAHPSQGLSTVGAQVGDREVQEVGTSPTCTRCGLWTQSYIQPCRHRATATPGSCQVPFRPGLVRCCLSGKELPKPLVVVTSQAGEQRGEHAGPGGRSLVTTLTGTSSAFGEWSVTDR